MDRGADCHLAAFAAHACSWRLRHLASRLRRAGVTSSPPIEAPRLPPGSGLLLIEDRSTRPGRQRSESSGSPERPLVGVAVDESLEPIRMGQAVVAHLRRHRLAAARTERLDS